MLYNFTTKNMSDMLFSDLSQIEDSEGVKTEALLSSPTNESIFPCRVIETPLENIDKTKGNIPIRKTFQVTIEHWSDKKRKCMDMAEKTDIKLKDRNFVRTNSSPIIFNEITKKYNFITTYEVRYNAILNLFEFIR